MKITDVDTYVLRADVDTPFTSARGWWYTKKNAMLVRVRTDDGLVGWGEAYGPPHVTKAVVDTLLAPIVVGRDPADNDVLWTAMHQRVEDYDPQGFGIAGLSAIDIALWDLKGQAAGVPVYALLGGAHRTTLRPYATGLYFTSADGDHVGPAVEEAVRYRDQGFLGVKMKIALPPREELARVTAVREALGDGVELMVDANHGYNVPTALRLGREFERMGLTWFEEPIPAHDLAGYAELRAKLDVPLAGGENAFGRHAFAEILRARAMDIIQPDVCAAGGVTEFQKIGALAEAAGVTVIPHVWGTAIGLNAALQVMAAQPPLPPTWHEPPAWMEYEQTQSPFREQLVTEPAALEDGTMRVPDRPGLGITVDEQVVAQYQVA
ncbi:mandelate racemase/muconate lactonizing enzyme family protein [Mycobacterium sp. NPDC003449]